MALKLLLCLLFVVTADPSPIEAPVTTPSATEAPVTTPSATEAPVTTPSATEAPVITPSPTEAPVTTPSPTEAPVTTSSPTEAPVTTPSPTEAPVTTSSPTEAPVTTSSPTTAESDTCNPSQCKGGSTCVIRGDSFECLCQTGDLYKDGCVRAKVFPGVLTHNGMYKKEMEDPTSAEFKRVADEIVQKITTAYKKKPEAKYFGSTVIKLSDEATETNIMTRAGKIFATVDIKFDSTSTETAKGVESIVEEFKRSDLCKSAKKPCDDTATCKGGTEGEFTCECNKMYIMTNFSDRICVACEKGKKAVDGVCVGCDFGYSGFNCEDDWQLILVIVGTIFGALLVVTTALIPVVAMKAKKKSKKGKADNVEKLYQNPAHMKPALTNGSALPRPIPLQTAPVGGRPGFGGNNVPRIPRANANESWEQGNLDRGPSNSRQNLVPGRNSRQFEDQDSNPYSRPVKSQNPYSGGRPQTNPYASNQGHSNPYFRNDEGRRY